jgi:hypothetical protein
MSLWASTTAPKVPLDAADGDEAESVRARFRERVSSPCGEDGEVEPAGHPPGGWLRRSLSFVGPADDKWKSLAALH